MHLQQQQRAVAIGQGIGQTVKLWQHCARYGHNHRTHHLCPGCLSLSASRCLPDRCAEEVGHLGRRLILGCSVQLRPGNDQWLVVSVSVRGQAGSLQMVPANVSTNLQQIHCSWKIRPFSREQPIRQTVKRSKRSQTVRAAKEQHLQVSSTLSLSLVTNPQTFAYLALLQTFPPDYATALRQAQTATLAALEVGHKLIEVEFPTSSLQGVSGNHMCWVLRLQTPSSTDGISSSHCTSFCLQAP